MNSSLFRKWITTVLKNHAKTLLPGKKGLLVVDNHKSHKYNEILSDLNKI